MSLLILKRVYPFVQLIPSVSSSYQYCRVTKCETMTASICPTMEPEIKELQSRPLCNICGRPREAFYIAKEFGIEDTRLMFNKDDKDCRILAGHTFYLGEFVILKKSADVQVKYYITSGLRQGIQSFAIHAGIVFHNLRPRYAIHLGICAGYSEAGVC